MQPEDFRCHQRVEVRWSEVDAQRIVFNAHYLMYADIAATAYWRQLALPYETGWGAIGGEVVVKKAELTYHGSAQMGDGLDLGMRCVRQGQTSLEFECGIFRGRQLLNSVRLVYVFIGPDRQPKPVPESLKAALTAFEAGEDMLEIRSGSWNEVGRQAERLRMAVFVREQGVPAEIEMDEFDPICRHVLACNRLGQPVATGRLILESPGVGRIGRMAVTRELRGSRVGRQVLEALVDAARQRGDREVVLHAQCHAQGFYARAGFVPEGETYDEAGIAHITMRIVL